MKRSFRGGTNRHRNDRRPLPQVSLRTWRRTAESSPKSRRTLSGKRQTTEAAFAEIRPSSSPAARVDQRPGRPHHRARHIRDGEAAPIRLGSTGDERWRAVNRGRAVASIRAAGRRWGSASSPVRANSDGREPGGKGRARLRPVMPRIGASRSGRRILTAHCGHSPGS